LWLDFTRKKELKLFPVQNAWYRSPGFQINFKSWNRQGIHLAWLKMNTKKDIRNHYNVHSNSFLLTEERLKLKDKFYNSTDPVTSWTLVADHVINTAIYLVQLLLRPTSDLVSKLSFLQMLSHVRDVLQWKYIIWFGETLSKKLIYNHFVGLPKLKLSRVPSSTFKINTELEILLAIC